MALCLTRRRNESLIFKLGDGSCIKVEVTEVFSDKKVRIAVTAPDSVEVVREELLYRAEGGWSKGKETHVKEVR